jgi:transposase-like protein
MEDYQKASESVKWGTPTGKHEGKGKNNTSIKVLDSGYLLEVAEEGLTAMFYQVGIEAVKQILEQDVAVIVGPKGKHNKSRTANRHGTEATKVVLNDRKISIQKPRIRSGGHDVQLPSLAYFQCEDQMDRTMLSRLLCGVSTRKYSRTIGTEGDEAACVSKSDVSRRFRVELKKQMDEFFNRRLDDTYPVIMVDGMERGGMTVIAALGVTSGGRKEILGLVEGATENSVAVKSLFGDIIERGVRSDLPRLFVLDGSKALAKAVRDTFGDMAQIQRCQVHKKRNVQSHLPESETANVGMAISRAYLEHDYDKALRQLNMIADNLDNRYPDAAASMREGLAETLTIHRLGLPGLLRKTLSNTNAMESANAVASGIVRRISKWQDGEMLLRHMAAAFVEAERGFRRIQGYRQLPLLITALYSATGLVFDSISQAVV